MADYGQCLAKDLKHHIRYATPDADDELLALTGSLGTNLLSHGYSYQHLLSKLDLLRRPETVPFTERVASLLTELDGAESEYTCLLSVAWPKGLPFDALQNLGISPVDRQGAQANASEKEFFDSARSSDIVAAVTLSALDPISARRAARQRFANALAVAKLYSVTSEARISLPECLVKRQNGDPVLIHDESVPSYMRNASNPGGRLKRFLDLNSTLQQDDADQLISALQYHQLAMHAPSDEARLVNLWIATEGLCRRCSGNSVIERVCTHISRVIALSYPMKVVRSLAIAVRSFWNYRDPSPLLSQLPNSTATFLDPNDLLKALLDREEDGVFRVLSDYLQDHPLLLHHALRLRNSVFQSPESLAKRMAQNRQHIDWQLRRIYRIRNDIIHRGASSPIIAPIIQHLHSYFVVTVYTIVHDLERNSGWSLPQAFAHRHMLFEDIIKQLKRNKSHTISRKALLYPDDATVTEPLAPAWPSSDL